ncbi:MAG: hypothetical protein AAGA85_18310 [Bacteroidota bacterium]
MAAISLKGSAQINDEVFKHLTELDTTIKELSYHNFQLMEEPLPFDLSADHEVARIRADHWADIDIGTLPGYRMPTYEPRVETTMPMAEIESTPYYTLQIQDFGAGKKQSETTPKQKK